MFTPRRTRRHALVHIAQGGGDPPLPTPRANTAVSHHSGREGRPHLQRGVQSLAPSVIHSVNPVAKRREWGGGLVGCLGVSRSGLQYRNPLSKLNLSLKIITLKDALEEKGGETSLR